MFSEKNIRIQDKLFILIMVILTISGCVNYEIEKDKVYYKFWNEARGESRELIKEADAKSFKTLWNHKYGKDKNSVFYRGRIIKGADSKSFKLIGDLYAIDKKQAYYAGELIESSTSKRFEVIDDYYSKDYKDIFYQDKPLHVCSIKEFKIFENDDNKRRDSRWSTDGCFYYFMNFKIPSDDYDNVILYKGVGGFAKDRKWVYYLNRKLNYTLEGKKILDTVDVESFTVTGFIECRDKFGCINIFHGREQCD